MPQRIIVASGVEIRDTRQQFDLMQLLQARAQQGRGNRWTYPPGPVANAQFEVELVFTKARFKQALEEDDAWVVYSGHSRYGQGPAFGPARTPHCPTAASMPTNPWGEHFRMGWDVTDTECIHDILEHGVQPTEYDLLTNTPAASLPSAIRRAAERALAVERARRRGRLSRSQRKRPCTIPHSWRSLATCKPQEAARPSLRPDQPLLNRHYYAQLQVDGVPDYLTAVQAGHADLDAVTLRCSALFMASCSSHVHYRQSLVTHRTAQRSACWFYFTMRVNTASHAATFVGALFNGHDPRSKAGSRRVLRALNGQADAGTVVVEKP